MFGNLLTVQVTLVSQEGLLLHGFSDNTYLYERYISILVGWLNVSVREFISGVNRFDVASLD
jgi:hypothetical protein